MTIHGDIAQLPKPKQLVELFVFDPTNIGRPSSDILRWTPGTTETHADIVWQGVTYTAYPVQADGFEVNATGKLPRPKLRASNIGGMLGSYLRSIAGGLGAKVIRKRTLGKYLDAVNFAGGNPFADPNAFLPDETFYLARKSVENPIFMEFELAVPFDVAGVQLPRRQVIASTCQWIYRDPATCTYTGPEITNDPVYPGLDPDRPVGQRDRCGKTLASCKLRFGNYGNLPFSGFPASLLARNA